jgi:hypothetical protein
MAGDAKVPDWLIERMAAGELSDDRKEAIVARLRATGEVHRLSDLAESDVEILSTLPPAQVAREIERRLAAKKPVPRVRPVWTVSLATACATAVVIFAAVFHKTPDENRIEDRIKGDRHVPALRIYRKAGGAVELLVPNAEVRKGDTLQIRYFAAGKRFGVIASIDGRGTVTLHLPETGGQAVALDRNGEHALAHSYELDDSPSFERFVFVTSASPFATDEVARSLRSGVPSKPPLASSEIVLRKAP